MEEIDQSQPAHPEQANGRPAIKVTRIDDLDQPIFRIFPLWFFEQALSLRNLVMMQPSKWPDPYEDVCSSIMMSDQRNPAGGQKQLHDFLMPAYAQCWSFESNSDILLRAYSRVTIHPLLKRNIEPSLEGVRVETTPRKLIQAVNAHAATQTGVQFYLGRMVYLGAQELTQTIVNTLGQVGAAAIGGGNHRADLLFLKRDYFRHEDEVRLLAIFDNRLMNSERYQFGFDPNHLFSKVEFDPRLISFERKEREAKARELGYNGEFGGLEESIRIVWDVPLPNGWEQGQPEAN